MKRKREKRAFTLIELLVVIAIIGILMTLMLPVLARAKASGHATQNRGNLKEIGSAFTMYVDDNNGLAMGIGGSDGRYFFGQYNGPSQPVDYRAGSLSAYVDNNAKIWQDPAFKVVSKRAQGHTCSYAYNYRYLNTLEEQGNWWESNYAYRWEGIELSAIELPVDTVLFGDSARNWMGPVEENWFWTPPSEARAWPGWETAYTHFRHRGKATVLWGDGRVEMVVPDETYPVNKDQLGYICDTNDRYFKLLNK